MSWPPDCTSFKHRILIRCSQGLQYSRTLGWGGQGIVALFNYRSRSGRSRRTVAKVTYAGDSQHERIMNTVSGYMYITNFVLGSKTTVCRICLRLTRLQPRNSEGRSISSNESREEISEPTRIRSTCSWRSRINGFCSSNMRDTGHCQTYSLDTAKTGSRRAHDPRFLIECLWSFSIVVSTRTLAIISPAVFTGWRGHRNVFSSNTILQVTKACIEMERPPRHEEDSASLPIVHLDFEPSNRRFPLATR